MGEIASQITSLAIVYSIVYSDADQRKHQSSASLAFVRGIHRGISRTKGQNDQYPQKFRKDSNRFGLAGPSNDFVGRWYGKLLSGPGEFFTQRPVTRSFDVFFDLRLNKRLSKQPWGWWFETPSWSLWRQCNEMIRSKTSLLPEASLNTSIYTCNSKHLH